VSLELAQVDVGIDVGLLHHVLGLAIVARDRARRAIEPLVVAAHEQLEHRGVAVEDRLDDILVALPAALGRKDGSLDRCGELHHISL